MVSRQGIIVCNKLLKGGVLSVVRQIEERTPPISQVSYFS